MLFNEIIIAIKVWLFAIKVRKKKEREYLFCLQKILCRRLWRLHIRL